MNCYYCGKELGFFSTLTRDADFCSPQHRAKYHAVLRNGIARLTTPAAGVLSCDFRTVWPAGVGAVREALSQTYPAQPCARLTARVEDWPTFQIPALRLTPVPESFAEAAVPATSAAAADRCKQIRAEEVDVQPTLVFARASRTAETQAPAVLRGDKIDRLASRLEQMRGNLLRAGLESSRRIA